MKTSATVIKRERKNWFYSYDMIFDQPISEHAKLIYLYLCRCADSAGQSFPSRSTIADKCSVSIRTVDKALTELAGIGLVLKERRIDASGDYTSNLYVVSDTPVKPNVESRGSAGDALPSITETGGSAGGAPPVVQEVHQGSAPPAHEVLCVEVLRIEGEREAAPAQNTYGEFKHVLLTAEQHASLTSSVGEAKTADYIDRVDRRIESKGLKSRSHYATIKDWMARDEGNPPPAAQTGSRPIRKNKFVNFQQRDRDFARFERLEREYQNRRLSGFVPN
jgi:hypothetical protein